MAKEKRFRKEQIMVWFIAFIMVSSVFAVMFYGYNEQGGSYKYNGMTFYRAEYGWRTKINNQDVVFSYLPEDIEDFEISDEVLSRLSGSAQIDFTSEINDSYADTIAVVQFNMIEVLTLTEIYPRMGFVDYETEVMPIIECSGSDFVPIVHFKSGDETRIYSEDGCIFAEAKDDNGFLLIKDRILYSLLGIIG